MKTFFINFNKFINKDFLLNFFGYNPKRFWNLKAKTFLNDAWQVEIHPQHAWILAKVREAEPKNILEVGCGFGRNIKFLIKNGISPKVITGVDISQKMLENAKEFLDNVNVKLFTGDANALPFKSKMFDLSLVHGVLMHIKPSKIKNVLGEICRVTKNRIINVEQNYLPDSKESNVGKYTFLHKYENLYRELGCEILEKINDRKLGLDYFYVKVR